MNFQLLKPKKLWLIGLVSVATVVSGAIANYGVKFSLPSEKPSTPVAAPPAPIAKKVTALGRLEPEAEVIRLSAPLALDGDRVAQLLVKENDRVKAGQVVAILDARDRLQDALKQAQEQVKVASSRLDQVKAGAKTGEIQAQQATIQRIQAELTGTSATQAATIARWESEVRNAKAEYNRFQQLFASGTISASSLDSKRLAVETAEAQLNEAKAMQNRNSETLKAQNIEAKANLNRVTEIRPVDIAAAQTDVNTAIAAVKRSQTELKQAYVLAPTAGKIFKLLTRAGEKMSKDGIVELGQTDQMMTIAEVYQTDVGKVKVGQQARITSQAFTGELKGTVSQIGLQVSRQNVFSNQPGENLDRRVVEVKIRLTPEDSKRVAAFTHLQVQTAIDL